MVNISAGNRQPSGKQRPRYTPRHAGAQNIKIRITHNWHLMVKHGSDPVWGSVVGVMFMEGILTEAEADAAVYFAEVAGRYDRYHPAKDGVSRTARAQSYEFGSRAADTEIERHNRQGTISSYERRAKKVRKLWEHVQDEIPSGLRDRVDQLCLLDQRPPEECWEPIKEALLRISRRFLHGKTVEQKQKKAVSTAKRSEVLRQRAQRALGNVLDYFKVSAAEPKTFKLCAGRLEFGIKVFGRDAAGAEVSHCVMLSLRKDDLVEHLASLFLKRCEALGWIDHKEAP